MKYYTGMLFGLIFGVSSQVLAIDVGEIAPKFSLADQNGNLVTVAPNHEKTWTVLYFYPKADTPGCTKQACAFRDSIKIIEKENAHVYGISTNSVKELKEFQDKYKLNFILLSDKDGAVSKKFGTKMPIFNMSKRHTFILDESLKVRSIDRDVDPAMDAKKVLEKLKQLRSH